MHNKSDDFCGFGCKIWDLCYFTSTNARDGSTLMSRWSQDRPDLEKNNYYI